MSSKHETALASTVQVRAVASVTLRGEPRELEEFLVQLSRPSTSSCERFPCSYLRPSTSPSLGFPVVPVIREAFGLPCSDHLVTIRMIDRVDAQGDPCSLLRTSRCLLVSPLEDTAGLLKRGPGWLAAIWLQGPLQFVELIKSPIRHAFGHYFSSD